MYSTRKFNDPHITIETNAISTQIENIKVYPNPAFAEINISSNEPISGIQIYSVTGKLMFQDLEFHSNYLKVETGEFAPGNIFTSDFSERCFFDTQICCSIALKKNRSLYFQHRRNDPLFQKAELPCISTLWFQKKFDLENSNSRILTRNFPSSVQ